jgi:hypothetical protein
MFKPGMYVTDDLDQGSKERDGEYHFDSQEFYYLNSEGNWCDVGWGNEPPYGAMLYPMIIKDMPEEFNGD